MMAARHVPWKDGMHDYLVAELRCPRCGTLSPAGADIDMQTYLRREGATLGVGYEFAPADLRTENVVTADYSIVAAPHDAGTLKLLEVWTCPSCETEQWAMVEIEGRRIARIDAVTMNRATLESANFISTTNGELLAAALMGISPMEYSERKLDSVAVLRERLQ